jgi:hypothetical protein
MRLPALLALAAVLVLAVPVTAQAATPGLYRTDNQAERHLETRLPAWAGVNLHPPANPADEFGLVRVVPAPMASCLNGAFSAREKRTKRHFRSRTNRAGEDTFRSFACTLSAYSDTDGDGQVTFSDDERTFHLYLQTRPHGRWVVLADR